MGRLTKEQWVEIKVKYETGDYSLQKLADEYELNKSTIHERMTRDGWEKGRIKEAKNEMVKIVTENSAKLSKQLALLEPNAMGTDEIEMLKKYSINQVAIRLRSQVVQDAVLETIILANDNAQNFIKNNPKGTYVKTNTDKGKTYGLTVEALSPLVQALNAANNVAKVEREQTIVNNYSQTNVQHMGDADTRDPKIVYEEMIKGDTH